MLFVIVTSSQLVDVRIANISIQHAPFLLVYARKLPISPHREVHHHNKLEPNVMTFGV